MRRHLTIAGGCAVLCAMLLAGPAPGQDATGTGKGIGETARTAGSDYVQPAPKPGHSYPECYCTDSRGARVEVGQLACLSIGSRQVLSRCEKRRNLVIWRHQEEGCAPGV